MSAFSIKKLRIADPFVEDNDKMLQRLIDEAFSSISHGRNNVNLMQAGTVRLIQHKVAAARYACSEEMFFLNKANTAEFQYLLQCCCT